MRHARWHRRLVAVLLAAALVPAAIARPLGGKVRAVSADVLSETLRSKLLTTSPLQPLEVIVRFDKQPGLTERSTVLLLGATEIRELKMVRALAVRVPALGVSTLALNKSVSWISEDVPVRPALDVARDRFWGISWRVVDADAARARLAAADFDVSEVRSGRRPGTRVFTVRAPTHGVATLVPPTSESATTAAAARASRCRRTNLPAR